MTADYNPLQLTPKLFPTGHAMLMMNNSIEAWYLSRLWEDDWFGHYSPNGYAVDGGRFAYLPIKQVNKGLQPSTLVLGSKSDQN